MNYQISIFFFCTFYSKHGLSGIRRSHNDYESLQSRKAIHSTELVTNDESGPYIYQPV
jgi:hypothetical protein